MSFDLNQAQYFFQYYMDLDFEGINSTTSVIDDNVMIHGETDGEHVRHLLQVLNESREIGLKLNPGKCEFGKTAVKFYGNIMSYQGLKPDQAKIIIRMPILKDTTELSSFLGFLGMCQYLSPYI